MNNNKVTNEKNLLTRLAEVKKAQQEYSKFTQEQVDQIFYEAAKAANENRIPLAQLAVEETRMGLVEDKVIKNQFASEFVYNKYKNSKTAGVIEENDSLGYERVAEPIGVVAAVIPTTNPTSTAIFKVLVALKTRNAIFIAPHPRAKNCTIKAAEIVMDAAVKAGAPKGLLGYIAGADKDVNPIGLTNLLMQSADLILATGGPGMVKAAYSSGKPALGVGAGNVPAVIDSSANLKLAVNSIIVSKGFDYGVICASEQAVIIDKSIYAKAIKEFSERGAYVLNPTELKKVRAIILKDGALNGDLVGQSPQKIGELAGIEIPEHTRIIVGEVKDASLKEPFAHEKLSVLLAAYKSDNFEHSVKIAKQLVDQSGLGHSSSIYIDETQKEKLNLFTSNMNTSRVLVNTPSSQGGIGDIYNFYLAPSLTLGCGSWGGNSSSENIGPNQLINIKTVAKRRENMLWMHTPEKIFYKYGSLSAGIRELGLSRDSKVMLVTDEELFNLNLHSKLEKILLDTGASVKVFSDIQPDPTLTSVNKGTNELNSFKPDHIIAFGGGSAIDAAKIMWLFYEQPQVEFKDISTNFMDILKRIAALPELGKVAKFVAIPSTSGTGTEVTPFSVITSEDGKKYPIADFSLIPNVAIVDPELTMTMPTGLATASGIDVFTHAIESYVSILASDYTQPYSIKSAQLVKEHLVDSVLNKDKESREHMANASCLAGIAFGNGFLGICHSLAHKLGARFGVPHGIANALLLNEVIKYNAVDAPFKQGIFSQYDYPKAKERYAEFAKSLGLTGRNNDDLVKNLVKFFTQLKKDLKVPLSIKDWGIGEKEFLSAVDEMAILAFDDQCTGANPRYPLVEDLKQLYLNAYYGTEK